MPDRASLIRRGKAPTSVESRELVVRTVELGGSKLSRALRAPASEAESVVASWIHRGPVGRDAWAAHAAVVRETQGTPDWHSVLAPAFDARGLAAQRLARAAASGVLVTTGQQPGLFGGPTYTWTKAIGALALADELEAAIDIPAAPVFWAATDDADWIEAAGTYFLTHAGLQSVQLVGPPTDGIAMMDVPLGDMDAAMTALRAASGSAAHGAVLDELVSAYRPEVTVGAAYLRLLRALLEPMGIAVLDASHPALRTASDPFLRRALESSAGVASALAERTAEVRAAGFVPQVETIDSLSLVFETRVAAGDRSQRRRERVPVADASRVARDAPVGSLGANVLLRPVLERGLLPTVAYLSGPGEFAYFAQTAPIATALGLHVPLPLPRWAGEVIEVRSMQLREALGIDEGLLRDPHEAESLLARTAIKDDVQDALERLRVTLETQTRALRSAVGVADDLVDPSVVEGLARHLAQRIDRFERRLVAGSKRREHALMRDVAQVRAAFRPLGTSPERVLNLMPVLARYGPEVFAMMRLAATAHAEALVHGEGEAGPFSTE